MNGILVIDKDKNMTSRDIVNILMKKFQTKKIGHTGTLDPIATGVLVVCVGKSTKLVEILTVLEKEYIFEAELGTLTDTLDNTGNIEKEKNTFITKEKVEQELKKMLGTYMQEVPIYSAVKVNGKKLYEYARNGIEVSLPKKEVTIKEATLEDIYYKNNKTYISVKINVSKGTYIRSFIRDLAHNLNTFGTMTNLRRTKQGNFTLKDAYTLDDIKKDNYSFISLDKVLDKYKSIEISDIEKIKNGALILKNDLPDIVIFTHNKVPIAIYKTYEKDQKYLKPWKML